MQLIHLGEGLRMFSRAMRIRLRGGFHEYSGSSQSICEQIIKRCWDSKHHYFRVSAGHFSLFYMRDFSWCVKPLLSFGYREQVRQTLKYALQQYSRSNKITTSISSKGACFDFPYEAVDSYAYVFHALTQLNDSKLIQENKKFLQEQIDHVANTMVDQRTHLIRADRYYSSMKDYARRRSSCYDNCMLYLLASSIPKGFRNPFNKTTLRAKILSTYFNGDYFYDDLNKTTTIAGDANVLPLWVGLIQDKKSAHQVINNLFQEQLDLPFPLRYQRGSHSTMHWVEIFNYGYERDVCWMHLGMLFLDVLETYKHPAYEKMLLRMNSLVKKQKNFLEVYSDDGKPFRSLLYVSDGSMLWSSMLLYHLKMNTIS